MGQINKYGNIFYYGLLGLIITCSFFHFSAVYYYFLNPDHAIHILMTANFRFPHDLYFWGQDRLGSFIPLLGHLILKITGMNAVWSVSIANYLILIAGFFCISTLFKNDITKLILAIFWFFPPLNFLDFVMIAQPLGIQMSLLAIVVCFFNKINTSQPVSKKAFLVSLLSVTLIISLWVSDLTIISTFLLVTFALYSYFRTSDKTSPLQFKKKNIFKEPAFYVTLFWAIAGLLLIAFAKSQADKDIRYTKHLFNDLHSILLTVKEILFQISDILTFSYEQNIFLGIFGWLSIISLILIAYYSLKNKSYTSADKWFWFFLAQAVLAFLAILMSQWVFRNGVSRRYFVLTYISIVTAVLLISKNFPAKQKTNISILLAITAIFGLLSSTVHIYYPKRQKSKYEVMKEFRRLGKAGIIAEYWNSYITAIAAPDNITATPNDRSYVRNKAMADSVFAKPDLYIIKDSWLDRFPEEIDQFGYRLQKIDNPFELGGANLCEYKIIKFHHFYTPGELKTSSKKIIKDTSSTHLLIEADSSMRFKYLVYGPFITLNKGKYKVIFSLKTEENSNESTVAILDVSSDYGKNKITKLKIKQAAFPDTTAFHPFELTFHIDSLTQNFEFRVYYTGKNKLWFEGLELKQLE